MMQHEPVKKIHGIMDKIKELIKSKFTGSITIHFHCGNISSNIDIKISDKLVKE